MCEFLERMRLTGTPTEEVRKWSGMTHRVVELAGPFPTPDEMRVELWLHEESATRLLDMCDRIDAEFDRTKTENAELRELVRGLCWCNDKEWNKGACDDCPIRGMAVGRCERVMRELGVEVGDVD